MCNKVMPNILQCNGTKYNAGAMDEKLYRYGICNGPIFVARNWPKQLLYSRLAGQASIILEIFYTDITL